MFYAFPYTVTSDDDIDAKHKLAMPLSAGIIHQVDVLFQKDCAHMVHVQIFHGGHQLWPSNEGKALRGDATVISFREFYELTATRNELHALIWWDDVETLYEVIIQIGILPRAILQPLNFDYLVAALAGLE